MKPFDTRKSKRLSLPKKLVMLPLSMLLALFVLIGGTLAWFIATDGRINPFRTGKYEYQVQAVDVFSAPASPAQPGEIVSKRVGAVNNGELSAFVRLLVLPSILSSDGSTLLPASFGSEVLIVDLNTTDWINGGDGYYYYLHRLDPGVSTTDLAQDLFSQVRIAPGLSADYNDANLKIEVKCESTDIMQWNYRIGWWNSADPVTAGALAPVDAALSALATA
ncbi:MAG: hypothetical protein LBQ33_05615 [Oscillospiraceae bacterium]|nr:hypothetical protein [Oscillospiraceae bacterium]